jgi:molybdenum cofactor guanylyltransferase
MPVAPPVIAAFILAGGKSTRMGTDKAFISLDGHTLLARALDCIRAVTSDVRIVGDRKKFAAFAPVVEDIFPGCGPLGGIHAALRSSTTDLNFILAVDVPFVTPALIHFLIDRAESSKSLVTVPSAGYGLQPLCAVYRREFAAVAEKALNESLYKLDTLFDPAVTQVVPEHALEDAGFPPSMFRNLNTPAELADAHK